MFAGNFAPRGWSSCDGQLLAISQNDALFSLFGTIYGGDGRTTFGLPDCRGRVPVGMGNGPGLSPRPIGQKGGAENVTLTANQIPAHSHGGKIMAASDAGTSKNPTNNLFAKSAGGQAIYHAGTGRGATPVNINAAALQRKGGGQNHSNMAASLSLYFIVSLVGIYPSRS